MVDTPVSIPRDFLPLTVVIPGTDREDLLGYSGNARFVGFFWDPGAGGAVWTDGPEGKHGHGENFTFTRFVRPLAFLYNVNFGTRGGNATHLLVWDRETASAYVAPASQPCDFLRETSAADRMVHPWIPLGRRSTWLPEPWALIQIHAHQELRIAGNLLQASFEQFHRFDRVHV